MDRYKQQSAKRYNRIQEKLLARECSNDERFCLTKGQAYRGNRLTLLSSHPKTFLWLKPIAKFLPKCLSLLNSQEKNLRSSERHLNVDVQQILMVLTAGSIL
jgi:hypothetical protein